MSADNTVLLFVLVWTFMTVCQADDITVSCDDVTGSVRKEVNLTCSVSVQLTECCITVYKFQYPKSINDTAIYTQGLPRDSCEQSNSFTCRYTPTTAMKGKFRFFVQTTCGRNTTEFTVNIQEPSLRKADESEDTGSKHAVITAVVGLFVIIILILIIVLMTIICKKQSFGFQRRMFVCIKRDDDNSNCPENVV